MLAAPDTSCLRPAAPPRHHTTEKVQPRRAAIGRFDGAAAWLACATPGGKVLLLNPHDPGLGPGGAGSRPHLNVNAAVTALAAGPLLLPASSRDVLLVGTAHSLQAFDVHNNRDLFFRDLPDGASCMVVGRCSGSGPGGAPLVLVGGNCCVAGYDARGEEVLWAATSGVVTALALLEAEGDDDGGAGSSAGSSSSSCRRRCSCWWCGTA